MREGGGCGKGADAGGARGELEPERTPGSMPRIALTCGRRVRIIGDDYNAAHLLAHDCDTILSVEGNTALLRGAIQYSEGLAFIRCLPTDALALYDAVSGQAVDGVELGLLRRPDGEGVTVRRDEARRGEAWRGEAWQGEAWQGGGAGDGEARETGRCGRCGGAGDVEMRSVGWGKARQRKDGTGEV